MKLSQLIHSVIFIMTIVGVGIVSVVNKPFNLTDVKNKAILGGESARALEAQYDDGLFLKTFGVNLWAAVEYHLFNEGKKGLVIGKDGWLFTEEEFISSDKSHDALKNNIDLIVWIDLEFKKRNIELVVVPIPSKARVYQERLNDVKPDELHKGLYQTLITELNNASVAVTDSYSAMQNNKNKQEQFLRTDTHWTPDGAKSVAENAAEYIIVNTSLDIQNTDYVTELKTINELKGDLMNYLPLSPWFDDMLPKADQLSIYETYQDSEAALDDLFGETIENVALVGTSYSANANWNFVGALKHALSTDIINYAEEGAGPIKPMMQFLERYPTEMPDLKLVIWEIPERYLSVSYEQAYATRDAIKHKDTLIAQEFKPTLNL